MNRFIKDLSIHKGTVISIKKTINKLFLIAVVPIFIK